MDHSKSIFRWIFERDESRAGPLPEFVCHSRRPKRDPTGADTSDLRPQKTEADSDYHHVSRIASSEALLDVIPRSGWTLDLHFHRIWVLITCFGSRARSQSLAARTGQRTSEGCPRMRPPRRRSLPPQHRRWLRTENGVSSSSSRRFHEHKGCTGSLYMHSDTALCSFAF